MCVIVGSRPPLLDGLTQVLSVVTSSIPRYGVKAAHQPGLGPLIQSEQNLDFLYGEKKYIPIYLFQCQCFSGSIYLCVFHLRHLRPSPSSFPVPSWPPSKLLPWRQLSPLTSEGTTGPGRKEKHRPRHLQRPSFEGHHS